MFLNIDRDVDMWLRTIMMQWYHTHLHINKFKKWHISWKPNNFDCFELLKFQRILLYTVVFVLSIMLTATVPHFDHSCKVCNIMTVIKSLKQSKKDIISLYSVKHIQTHKNFHGSWVISLVFTLHACYLHSNVTIVIAITIAIS